jgi:hypothetical protein
MEEQFQDLLCRGDYQIGIDPVRLNAVTTIWLGQEGYMRMTRVLNEWMEENNSQLTKKRNMARQIKEIKVPEVLKMLETGHTRYKKDDAGFGSIQEKLGLTVAEVQEIFKHSKLANKKTKFPSRIKLIDEDGPAVVTTAPEELPKVEQKEEKKEEPKKEDDVFS